MRKIAVIGVPGGWSSEQLADAVAAQTGERCLIDPREVVLDLARGQGFWRGQDLQQFDALIIKKIGVTYAADFLDRLELFHYLEQKGLTIFSRPSKLARVLNRFSCSAQLSLAGLPLPPTRVTLDPAEALAAIEQFGKAILKPLYSTKARGMVVVEAGPDAAAALQRFQAQHRVLYVQQLLRHPGRDLGLWFLGGEYLATYARVGAENTWNTTVCSGGSYQPHTPSQQIIDLARRAQALFGLDFTCVDVVETADGPYIFEVSAFGGFRGLQVAEQLDVAPLLVSHILRSMEGG